MPNGEYLGTDRAARMVVFPRSRWKAKAKVQRCGCTSKQIALHSSSTSTGGRLHTMIVMMLLVLLQSCWKWEVLATAQVTEKDVLTDARQWAESGEPPRLSLVNGSVEADLEDVWYHDIVAYPSKASVRHAVTLRDLSFLDQYRVTMTWSIQINCTTAGKIARTQLENSSSSLLEVQWLHNGKAMLANVDDISIIEEGSGYSPRLELLGDTHSLHADVNAIRGGNYSCKVWDVSTGKTLHHQTTSIRFFNLPQNESSTQAEDDESEHSSLLPTVPSTVLPLARLPLPMIQNITDTSVDVAWNLSNIIIPSELQLVLSWKPVHDVSGPPVPTSPGLSGLSRRIRLHRPREGRAHLPRLIPGTRYEIKFSYQSQGRTISRGMDSLTTLKKAKVQCSTFSEELKAGSTLVVSCNVTGDPMPDNVVSAHGATIRYIDRGSLTTLELTFSNVTVKKSAGPKCVTAENDLGHSRACFRIVLESRPCPSLFHTALVPGGQVDYERSSTAANLRANALFVFKCKPGWVLIGNYRRQCQNNGDWDGQPATCKEPEPVKLYIHKHTPTVRLVANRVHDPIKCNAYGLPMPTRMEWAVNYTQGQHQNWWFGTERLNGTLTELSCKLAATCELRPAKKLLTNDIITFRSQNTIPSTSGQKRTHTASLQVRIKVVGRYGVVDDTIVLPVGKSQSWTCQRAEKWKDSKVYIAFWKRIPDVLFESWKRGGKDMTMLDKINQTSDPIVIKEAAGSDSGIYACFVQEEKQPAILMQTLRVVVHGIRVVPGISTQHAMAYGSEAVLQCRISGATQATWKFNHQLPVRAAYSLITRILISTEVTRRPQGSPELSSELRVPIMQSALDGVYTCVGSNGYRNVSIDHTLHGIEIGQCMPFSRTSSIMRRCAAHFNGGRAFQHVDPRAHLASGQFFRALSSLTRGTVKISEACRYELDNVERFLCRAAYPACMIGESGKTDQSWPTQHCYSDCTVLEEGACKSEWKQLAGEMGLQSQRETICQRYRQLLKVYHPTPNFDSYQCISTRREDTPQTTDQDNCYCDRGQQYKGTVSTASNNFRCQPWESNSSFHDSHNLKKNYCRNPSGLGQRPWCYTRNVTSPVSQCDLKVCNHDISSTCKTSEWLKRTLPICSDLRIFSGRQVRQGKLPARMNLASLNDAISALMSMHMHLPTGCAQHLKQLLCLTYAQVCSRKFKGHCGNHHIPCRSYYETFSAVCGPSLHDLVANYSMDDSTSEVIQNLLSFSTGAQDGDADYPECIRLPMASDVRTNQAYSSFAECLPADDAVGESYRGNMSTTRSNYTCQPWTAKYPHIPAPQYLLGLVPNLDDNKCRNPFGLYSRPWCYTTNPNKRWEYCNSDLTTCPPSPDEAVGTQVSGPATSTILAVGIGCFSIVVTALIIISYVVHLRRVHAKAQSRGITMMNEVHPLATKSLPRRPSITDTFHYTRRPILDRLNPEKRRVNPLYSESAPGLFGITNLSHSQLDFQAKIAEGNFGTVWRAIASNVDGQEETTVAVKTLKGDCNKQMEEGFLKEAQIISRFKHINIIGLLGICGTDQDRGNPLCLVFEYMEYGDLLHFLKEAQRRRPPALDIKGRPVATVTSNLVDSYQRQKNILPTGARLDSQSSCASANNLDTGDLCKLAAQIAYGMHFLSSRRYLHRDLAARNCLVGKNLVVKIADFGLSRDIHNRDYYKPEAKWASVPVRWMPPEVIKYGKHSTESDTWSFGIVLWEIFTFGGIPYYEFSNEEVVRRVCEMGRRLPQPHDCPQGIYTMMMDCWHDAPEERPMFRTLWKRLNNWKPPSASPTVNTKDGSGGSGGQATDTDEPEDDEDQEDDLREDEVFDGAENFLYVTSPNGNIVPVQESSILPAISPASSLPKFMTRKPLKSDSGVHVGAPGSPGESPMSEDINYTDESLSGSTAPRSASRTHGRSDHSSKNPQHHLSTSSGSLCTWQFSPPGQQQSAMAPESVFLEQRSDGDGAPELHVSDAEMHTKLQQDAPCWNESQLREAVKAADPGQAVKQSLDEEVKYAVAAEAAGEVLITSC